MLFFATLLYWAANAAREQGDKLRSEIEAIEATNRRLAVENERLLREAVLLKTSESLVKVARDDLGMVRPGEVVFFVAH